MDSILKTRARELRKTSSNAEKHLWYALRAARLHGYKFRRQYPIDPYIVDFICIKKKLIIELDGGQHAVEKDYDDRRTAFLEARGYRVLRFWNNVVFSETEGVITTILQALVKE